MKYRCTLCGFIYDDEKEVAKSLRYALENFFILFSSELAGRDFYISGESYGGIYVPMLAYNIIQYNKNMP